MSEQVIGFFNTVGDAEKAAAGLISAGFSRNAIHTLGRDASSSSTTASAGTAEHEGLWQRVKEFFGGADESDQTLYQEAYRRGNAAVAVDAVSETEVDRVTDILQKHHVIDIDQQAAQWRQQGWSGIQATQAAAPAAVRSSTTAGTAITGNARASTNASQDEVLPVIEEELKIGKRRVTSGGVRVYSRVTERPVNETVSLHEEHVHVERRPVDRPVTANDHAFQERAIEATETREEAVVQKVARVVEEVVVRKDAEDRTQNITDTVRRTDVQVEKVPTAETTTPTTGSTQTPRKNP